MTISTKEITLLDSPLDRLALIASRGGMHRIEEEAIALSARVAEGRFYVACVGQFKRGKSTLLDALLGEAVLPMGVVPVTALPTIVRYGLERSARVMERGSDWHHIDIGDLESYISEEQNPENEKDIAAIEVFLPIELLATGMCLVDTPGVGSVFETSAAATYEFIPHIDAALVVLGADPPVSGDELTLITSISKRVGNVIFVINKADRVTSTELAAARQFTGRVLGERLGRPIEIYEVSAREELEGNHGAREWPAFMAALEHMLSGSGRRLIWLAQERGATRLIGWLRNSIAEETRALVEPLAESEARLHRLDEYVSESAQAVRDLALLFLGEQQRLTQRLEERRQNFLSHALPEARDQLLKRLGSVGSHGPAYRRALMQIALDIARETVMPWLKLEERTVNEEYTTLVERFSSLASDFLARLAAAGVPHLGHVADSIGECGKLTSRSEFQFLNLLRIARPASPLRHAGDYIFAAFGMERLIRADAEAFLVKLLDVNTSRVQSDLENRLVVARRELELVTRGVLEKAQDAAYAMLEAAREIRAAGEPAIQAQLVRFADLEREINELSYEFSGGAPRLIIPRHNMPNG